MDTRGARLLAARLRAGVRVGMEVELVGDCGRETGLLPGDRGVVTWIDETGDVVVHWDRGFDLQLDPVATQIRPLAA